MTEMIQLPFTTEQERLQVFGPAIDRFANGQCGSPMRSATMKMVDSGRPEAYLVPIIDYTTRTALELCNLPSVQERMPAEVSARAQIAAYEAGRIAVGGMLGEHKLFVDAYYNDPILREGLNNFEIWDSFFDEDFLISQCGSPFNETAFLASGALRALGEQKLSSQASGIIARSKNLLLFSSVPKGHRQKALVTYLGGLPYSSSGHYDVNTSARRPRVDFTEDASTRIRKLLVPGRGCPSANIAFKGEGTVLRHAWGDIVRYLLSGQPTISVDAK